MEPWRDRYTVRSYETDPQGHLSLAWALRYLQESAWNHARSLGFGFDPRGNEPFVWVLARLRFVAASYPQWGDSVTVETWPVGVDRLFALRDFRILDGDGRAAARASSGWLIIERASRRPRRPEQVMSDLGRISGMDPVAGLPSRIAAVPPEAAAAARTVCFTDIDLNGHVNNVRYLEWVLDDMTPCLADGRTIELFEASYLSEALLGETVMVRSAQEGMESRHAIAAGDGNRELCRIRLSWRAAANL